MEIWTAFTLGLFGSLHCIGMCGPIALSLPYQDKSKVGTITNMLLYNSGRTFSYTLIGIIPGLLGLGVFISGYQTSLSIFLGILMLVIALFSINFEKRIFNFSWYQRFSVWLRNQFSKQLKKRTRSTFLSIGILNGFLPCGMVYLAVVGAITQGGIFGAMIYMLLFGLGTLPLMLTLSFTGSKLQLKYRKQLFKVAPVVVFLFGTLLIVRGLGIELPSDMNFWFVSGLQKMCF